MKQYYFLISVSLIVVLLFSFFVLPDRTSRRGGVDEIFVGVTFSGDSVSDAKLLIDWVKNFTNLLVVQSGPASKNETMLNEICDYAVNASLSTIVYFGMFDHDWQPLWLDSAKEKWGSSFLGVYFFDEPAGSLLDSFEEQMKKYQCDDTPIEDPENYDEMADFFVHSWETMPGLTTVKERAVPLVAYTSDYALYWFDYLAGYDIVFAQFGWNHSREQDIALIRGAAKVQDKTWGIIVTWTFNNPPYLEDGERLYEDLVMAYNNGAKYFVVFNYPTINDYGILNNEHFLALERFWQEIQVDSDYAPVVADSVLVLPKNYGWGMRNPNDSIWRPEWGPDAKSPQIWNISRTLLSRYSTNLDIVYDDNRFPLEDKYSEIIYWNSTIEN
ncbi:MAG: hypothetical protein JSW14_05795 [Candidatus Bathyarchaeum sp.]|nr:MAG: hypothetical protein JSW14_05795 [Candidatus Bathyarchaeum sp.]